MLVSERSAAKVHSGTTPTTAASVLAKPTAAVSVLRTPPSTRVSNLYEPTDAQDPARSLLFTDARDRDDVRGESAQERQPNVTKILDTTSKYVTPFYGVAALDKNRTVMSFVENVEMVMGNLLPPKSPHRLLIVQMSLRDSALTWLNNTLIEMAHKAPERDLHVRPWSWDDEVRQQFIDAFIGTDMVELWLAQLSALRLGEEKTMTPIELNIQFDSLARHVYPNRASNDDELLLAIKYRDIVAASNLQLHDVIMRTYGSPSTLKDWKIALAKQWNAEQQIKAVHATRKAAAGLYRGRDIWRGRGGSTGGFATVPAKAAAMNVVYVDDGAGTEGQVSAYTEDTQQLNAVANSSQRGGSQRGGRGGSTGRGRGGAAAGQRTEWSDEKKKLYENRRCFRCGGKDHMQRHAVVTEVLHRPNTSPLSSSSTPATNTSSSKAAQQNCNKNGAATSEGTKQQTWKEKLRLSLASVYALLEEDEPPDEGPASTGQRLVSASSGPTIGSGRNNTIVARGQMDGVWCDDMLIDTGASCCFVRRSWLQSTRLAMSPLKQPVAVTLADRSTVLSTHEVQLKRMTVHGSVAACTLLVMDELSNDVIVGLNWQRATGITITPGNPSDLLNGQPVISKPLRTELCPFPAKKHQASERTHTAVCSAAARQSGNDTEHCTSRAAE
ncbi:hypothetical protein MMC15_008689 [Xylographa vitiligo]|nr:hypothetical protein [Xylographa vitiligo]